MDVEYLWNARSWHAILEQFDTLKHALLEKNIFYTALTRQVIGKLKKNLIIRNRLLYSKVTSTGIYMEGKAVKLLSCFFFKNWVS